ncbi:MAG: hypothetical protein IPM85_14375 [Chitinophagaceae bacterium]|nr:hypothetical protein [Chitinophagaceae bacterium]
MGESYTPEQNKLLKKQFPLMLREIAAQGFIANHFLYSAGHFCEEYIEPMQQWFAENGIHLNSDNYTAFYFVYVLLNGPTACNCSATEMCWYYLPSTKRSVQQWSRN